MTRTDRSLLTAKSPAKDLEMEAMSFYRRAHPEGPDWLDLHVETRIMLIEHAKRVKEGQGK